MGVGRSRLSASEWLVENGWFPGRDIGEQAQELINFRLQDAERQGYPLTPFGKAVEIVHSYGLLELPHPRAQGRSLVMDPKARHEGDVEEIAELAANLGQLLFPVGYETADLSLLLVDEGERFFYLHHTGSYYVGAGVDDMFARFIDNVSIVDAEDFFVE
ncbi:hypothetical protein AQI95_37360 [Streptomyces yokosukanensis]|uniref:SUKH-3 domain containing protein n=2 Tax=Streptomyces yokosukanensis TaxID=67386 RepID=A0A101NUQ6_9ACTN|nr:SUKH-3 domain-containing protein [Streptomyces yokosukanensis]KUM99646.1 hypothetical protein AQI95_37360 [Streptomyces yokosukanensis]